MKLTFSNLQHSEILQYLALVASPLHSFPRFAGFGFAQDRLLYWYPSPHIWSQDVHGDHSVQPPSTKYKKYV